MQKKHIHDTLQWKKNRTSSNVHLHLSFACADEIATIAKIDAINQFVFILTLNLDSVGFLTTYWKKKRWADFARNEVFPIALILLTLNIHWKQK